MKTGKNDYIPGDSIYIKVMYKDRKQISGCLGMGWGVMRGRNYKRARGKFKQR